MPTLCKGAFCENGRLKEKEIDDYVLNPVNRYRRALIAGTQSNGASHQKLPKPQFMTKLTWSCDLEKIAMHTLKGRCPLNDVPSDKDGRGTVFFQNYAFGAPMNTSIIKTVFVNELAGIDIFTLRGVTSNEVVYKSKTPSVLRTYVNVIRPEANKIGCAWTKCKEEDDPFAVYCVLNAKYGPVPKLFPPPSPRIATLRPAKRIRGRSSPVGTCGHATVIEKLKRKLNDGDIIYEAN
ncbi:hypothetical protein Y032_0087g2033 [Ancylostoma ceylanicum]|nr:hypothetical protein Y032_0087g2033 [Ancylostoma ceylanicum]